MLWRLHQINKPWFFIVDESVFWNMLEVVRLNRKFYFQHVATSHTPRQSFQMQFEGKFQTLQKFMEPRDLVEPTPLSSVFYSENSMCNSTHIYPTNPMINLPVIFVTLD
jgi:hypothetical protein